MVSNKERLQANNAELQELIGVAEALPDAGSGGEEYLAEFERYFEGEGSSLTLPNATAIKGSVFIMNQISLKITAPKVKSIGDQAFYYCSGLEMIDIPSVEIIGTAAFMECRNMKLEKLPDSVTQIGRAAFTGCDGATFTHLPSAIQKIDDLAFQSCEGLTSLTILSETCPFFGTGIFNGCTNLTTINVAWSEDENPASYPAPWGAPNATINYNYTGG